MPRSVVHCLRSSRTPRLARSDAAPRGAQAGVIAAPRAPNRGRTARAGAVALGVALSGASWASAAVARREPEPPASASATATDEGPPTWRFHRADRPVKVVVLAGSVGAYPRDPYAEQLEGMCARIEVKNLSKTGAGVGALKRRFDQQVLANPRLDFRAQTGHEHWLLFGGGLNSVGSPHKSNKDARALFLKAHRRGFKVVALSPTPWGATSDPRWRGTEALRYRTATETMRDFMIGRSTPGEALGSYVSVRGDAPGRPWEQDELADVGVDLYDSALRDRGATPWPLDAARTALARSSAWTRAHAELPPEAQTAALERDAARLSETPRWWMRPELHAFDHIHPNVEGHRLIAATVCPNLPPSWGCSCPPAP
jgi:hypothetical protein